MASLPVYFETKDFVGIALLLGATGLTTIALLFSQRLRECALFLMITGAVLTEKLDINFLSAYWYRGTTRGFEATPVDVLAVALLFSTLLNPRHAEPGTARWFWPAGLAPMLLFMFWAVVSVALAEPRIFGLYELSKLGRGLVIFLAAAFFVRSRRELAIIALALCCTAGLEALSSLRQRYGWGVYRVTGTLDHPNSLSMYLCMVAPVLVAAAASDLPAWLRRCCWLAAGGAAITIMLTVSRAGIPIFAAVAGGAVLWCVSWRPTPGKLAAVALAVLGLAVLVGKSWDLLAARYQQASLTEEYLDPSKEGRGYYFRLAGVILDDRPWGVGLNNWSYWVSQRYAGELGVRYESYDDILFPPPNELLPMYRYAAPAHNLGALTAGELGWPGLAVFALLWLRWLHVGAGFLRPRLEAGAMHRLGLGLFLGCGGVFLQSVTEWTFRQTQIFLTFHLLLGVLAALHHQRRLAGTESVAEEEAEEAPEQPAPWAAPRPEPVEI